MNLNTISPIDNLYYDKIKQISSYFSLESWIKYRLRIELHYLESLIINLLKFSPEFREKYYICEKDLKIFIDKLNIIERNCDVKDIIEIEKETEHDIKAIEYYIVNQIKKMDLKFHQFTNLVHFGLTSQDINSVAFSCQLKNIVTISLIPTLNNLLDHLDQLVSTTDGIIMLGHTHGQPAIPTNIGKEFEVFVQRLNYWTKKIINFEYYTKMGGVVGSLNAHIYAYPDIDWVDFFDEFIKKLGFKRWTRTTQITNYDDIVDLFGIIVGINNVLLDLSQDCWLYISKGYFKLKCDKNKLGTSIMSQKINPINFENAEGNLKMANCCFNMLINKLPVSRLQRDLIDNTMLRNVGVYFAHTILAYGNIMEGLSKLEVDNVLIYSDLEAHPECLSEAIQILMKTFKIENSYDIVRQVIQNNKFKDLEELKQKIIDHLDQNDIDYDSEFIEKLIDLNYNNY
jgi:adenylosuccinate lyase